VATATRGTSRGQCLETDSKKEEVVALKSPSWFKRLSRFSGWALLPLMLLQFLSGYAILHPRIFGGFLAKPTAFKLHGTIQPITAVLASVVYLRVLG